MIVLAASLLFSVMLFPEPVRTYPSGAGACLLGTPSVGGPHLAGEKAEFDTLYELLLNDSVLLTDKTTFVHGETYKLTVLAPSQRFKGALIRVQGSGQLEPGSNAKDAFACGDDAEGVTQTGKDEKSDLSGFYTVGTSDSEVKIDVTVVESLAKYAHQQFVVPVEQAKVDPAMAATVAATVAFEEPLPAGPIQNTSSPLATTASPTTEPAPTTLSPTTGIPTSLPILMTSSPVVTTPSPVTLSPTTEPPTTLTPTTGTPTSFPIPSTSTPMVTTPSPSTISLTTQTPSTQNPNTATPTSKPIASTSSPIMTTPNPTTLTPSMESPSTPNPTTFAPFESQTATLAPSTVVTGAPITVSPPVPMTAPTPVTTSGPVSIQQPLTGNATLTVPSNVVSGPEDSISQSISGNSTAVAPTAPPTSTVTSLVGPTNASPTTGPPSPLNCAELDGCFLQNLDTGVVASLSPSSSFSMASDSGVVFDYTVFCNMTSQGETNKVQFLYGNGDDHTEWKASWYMNGNTPTWIEPVHYLTSDCSAKSFTVVASVWTGECSRTNFLLTPNCSESPAVVHDRT